MSIFEIVAKLLSLPPTSSLRRKPESRCAASAAHKTLWPADAGRLDSGLRRNDMGKIYCFTSIPITTLHRCRGLTLVEAAIVLGIVGIVAGAIWGTMTAVKKQQAISDTAQTILQIASTIKATYTGHASTATPPTTVATQIANGLYPPHVINAAGTNTVNAWGGTLFIQFPPALAVDGFALMFTFPAGMDRVDRRAACMAIVSRYSGSATAYAGGFVSNVLPAVTIPLSMTEAGMPALTFINRGGWTNVTGLNPTALFPAAADNCTGFAVYFKL